tara:strand:+ start:3082 stop:3522 length:441 start_codon:yes stop_codon:yes gene_type:complete
MNIDLIYQDKFKFENEKQLFQKYKNRIEALKEKKILSSFNEVLCTDKKISEILKNKKKSDFFISLDENGKTYTSIDFSNLIFSNHFKKIFFFIGGTDGLTKMVLDQSDQILSLSKMTFTHSFAAIILLEQIYRSATIKLNHPYHRN